MTVDFLQEEISAFFDRPMERSDAYFDELNRLYFHVTGVVLKCRPCQVAERRRILRNWLANPIKVYQTNPIIIKEMATKSNVSTKYALAEPKQTVVIFGKHGPEAITADTLTDEAAERILADKNFSHNIVTIKQEETAKTAARKEESK